MADPASARPHRGAVAVLGELVRRGVRVAVVSGRSLEFLDELIPPAIDIAALYGIEWRADGRRRVDDAAVEWEPVVRAAVVAAVDELPHDVGVEDKTWSLTLHTRTCPDHGEEVRRWAGDRAEATGLELRPAKASIELHPPLPVSKGTAVRHLAAGREVVIYAGDDLGDLDAFAALDALEASGVETLRVAVGGVETPPEVTDAADVVVEGPEGMVDLLRLMTRPPRR